jgi:hypothetical protein
MNDIEKRAREIWIATNKRRSGGFTVRDLLAGNLTRYDRLAEEAIAAALSAAPAAVPVGLHPTTQFSALQKLAARLAELLDEDHWAECEEMLLEIENGPWTSMPVPAAVPLDAVSALIDAWDQRAKAEHAASQDKNWAEWLRERHYGASGAFSTCKIELKEALAAHPQPAAAGDKVRPMDTAPLDGTMLRLLVEFTDHATEDTNGAAWTIGANSFDETGEDLWQFAGWCWTHDHFTEGKGTPVGWLPLIDQQAKPEVQ